MSLNNFLHKNAGSLLVTLQLVLITLLALWATPKLFNLQAPFIAWALALFGVGIGTWTLRYNRPGNFNIRPQPHDHGHLICDGPYRWIRHPMYSAVILCAIAAATSIASPSGWFCMIALIAVLVIKLQVEEELLTLKYPEYASYRSHTWRLLPGLF